MIIDDSSEIPPFLQRVLTVDYFGAFVGKHSERIRVSVKGEVKEERAMLDLEQILMNSGNGLSKSAMS